MSSSFGDTRDFTLGETCLYEVWSGGRPVLSNNLANLKIGKFSGVSCVDEIETVMDERIG
jgi:hypothetical protein